MSVWNDVATVVGRLGGGTQEAFASLVEALKTAFAGDRTTRRRVAFSIALIALSAKMAKADGIVTPDEVRAFQEVFTVPEEEFGHVRRLYNLAREDVAGYDQYAQQVRTLFPGDGPEDAEVLGDVLDALFHIAKADGVLHEREMAFLRDVADTFAFDELAWQRLSSRHVDGGRGDPFAVLGGSPDMDLKALRRLYLRGVRENHPDRLLARGVPEEFLRVASDRTAALNEAWSKVQRLHGRSGEGAAT